MSNGNTAIPVSPVVDMIRLLQEGEAAKEKVPALERFNSELNNSLLQAQSHNQRLEENILAYKNTIAELASKVRSLEVERDDAGFRVLETEDKFDKLKQAIRHATGDLDATLMQVDPPRVEPEVKGSSEPIPTASPAESTGMNVPSAHAGASANAPHAEYKPFTPPANPSEGSQSKPDPIASQETTKSPSVLIGGAGNTEDVGPNPAPWNDRPWRT